MSDVIRLDKVLINLIKEYKEIELADRQKDLAFFDKELSDSSDRDRYVRKAQDMIDTWSAKDDKDILQYALLVAIGEIKRKNNWQ